MLRQSASRFPWMRADKIELQKSVQTSGVIPDLIGEPLVSRAEDER